MKHHEQLIAMRMRGHKPPAVTLDDTDWQGSRVCGLPMAWWAWPETQASPEVQIEPQDHPARADLRFLVGIDLVTVSMADYWRMRDFVLACERAGARKVLGFCPKSKAHPESVLIVTDQGDQSWRS